MSEPLKNPIILKRETQNSFIVLQGNTRMQAALRCLPKIVAFTVDVEGEGLHILKIEKPAFPQQPYREGLLEAADGTVTPIRFLVN